MTDTMWAFDIAYGGTRLQDEFSEGDEFILLGIGVGVKELVLSDGQVVTKSTLNIAKLDNPNEVVQINSIASAIARLAKSKQGPDDLPAVVRVASYQTQKGNSGQKLELVRPYKYEGDIPECPEIKTVDRVAASDAFGDDAPF